MSKKLVLIVEDEENLVELLRFRLESNGYDVDVAFDGSDGLRKIESLKPDIVLLDIMMPKMHGYDVCKAARANEATKDIPIIILTARTNENEAERAKEYGASGFISKPFEPDDLLKRIKELLD